MPTITIGCDPEFLVMQGENTNTNLNFNHVDENGHIGIDHSGRVGELRPKPGTPYEVTMRIKNMFAWIKENHRGYSIICGGGADSPHGQSIGGHIHVGGIYPIITKDGHPSWSRDGSRKLNPVVEVNKLILAFDFFIGLRLKKVPGGQRPARNSAYGKPSAVDITSWGLEYRTPPSWLTDPQLTESSLAIMKRITEMWVVKPSCFDAILLEAKRKRIARKSNYEMLIPESPASERRYYQEQIANFKRIVFSKTYRMDSKNCLDFWLNSTNQTVTASVSARRGSERIELKICQIKIVRSSAHSTTPDFEEETVLKVCRFAIPEIKIIPVNYSHTPWHLQLTRDFRLKPNTIYLSKSLRQFLKVSRGGPYRVRFVELKRRSNSEVVDFPNAILYNCASSTGDINNEITRIIEQGARTKIRR
jgi:hypothetical protein